jgi:hypothetical protein
MSDPGDDIIKAWLRLAVIAIVVIGVASWGAWLLFN